MQVIRNNDRIYQVSDSKAKAFAQRACECGVAVTKAVGIGNRLFLYDAQGRVFSDNGQCDHCHHYENRIFYKPIVMDAKPPTTTNSASKQTTGAKKNYATQLERGRRSKQTIPPAVLHAMSFNPAEYCPVATPNKLNWAQAEKYLRKGYVAQATQWNPTQMLTWDKEHKIFITWDNGRALHSQKIMRMKQRAYKWEIIYVPNDFVADTSAN